MKYNESNKPLVCMQTQSTCYKGTSKMVPKGVLWHSTGANNPTLKRYVQPSDVRPKEDTYSKEEWLEKLGKNQYNNDWNHIVRQAGLNAWIGKLADGTVTTIQTMPWDFKPWGCGSGSKGSCNNGWMQFEICEDNLEDKNYFEAVYREACEITAYYCKMYNLDPRGTVSFKGVKVPVILDHKTSYELGLGGNHSDVRYWLKKYGKTLDNVREDVATLMGLNEVIENKPIQSAEIQAGDLVSLAKDTVYYNSTKAPGSWILAKNWYVKAISGNRAVIDKSEDGAHSINSPVDVKYLTKISGSGASTSAPQPQPVVRSTVKLNSNGEDVKYLQTRLKELGFDCKGIDGIFGKNTQTQVIAFQKERKLDPDGICGPKTWEAIDSFKEYDIKVNVAALNVRSGPGSSYSVKSVLNQGQTAIVVYKIGDWAKLKNGAGWIDSNYVVKI